MKKKVTEQYCSKLPTYCRLFRQLQFNDSVLGWPFSALTAEFAIIYGK